MKEYLGDGVYIKLSGDMFKLTTEDGISETNIIWLELEVAQELANFLLKYGIKGKK